MKGATRAKMDARSLSDTVISYIACALVISGKPGTITQVGEIIVFCILPITYRYWQVVKSSTWITFSREWFYTVQDMVQLALTN